jgi:hypothetical protein
MRASARVSGREFRSLTAEAPKEASPYSRNFEEPIPGLHPAEPPLGAKAASIAASPRTPVESRTRRRGSARG